MIPIEKLALKDLSCKEDYEKSLTKRLNDYLDDICYGDSEHEFAFIVEDIEYAK